MGGVSRSTKICDGRNVRDDIVTDLLILSRQCHGLSRAIYLAVMGYHGSSLPRKFHGLPPINC